MAQHTAARISSLMPTATSWDEFRLVKAIADARSLVGAAEKLAINHSTVFRRLGALEEAMGARLFERSRNGYTPTPAGEEMIALATRMEQEIVDFERAVAGRSAKPAGELRLTTNDAFLSWLLGPMLASFRKAFPEIRLDVVVGHQHLNLSRRDADVALRATVEPPETLVGRKIAHIAWAVLRAGDFNGRDNERPWVGFGEGPGVVGARRWFEDNVAPDAIVCRVDSVAGVARAIEVGPRLGPAALFHRRPACGRDADRRDPAVRRRHVAADASGPASFGARARLHGARGRRADEAAAQDRRRAVIARAEGLERPWSSLDRGKSAGCCDLAMMDRLAGRGLAQSLRPRPGESLKASRQSSQGNADAMDRRTLLASLAASAAALAAGPAFANTERRRAKPAPRPAPKPQRESATSGRGRRSCPRLSAGPA